MTNRYQPDELGSNIEQVLDMIISDSERAIAESDKRIREMETLGWVRSDDN